jgi:nucleoside-diphosphate-sugar epimerase
VRQPVVILARAGSKLDHARSLGAEIRTGDLLDPESLNRAAEGCDQIIHTAALASDWAMWEDFCAANVQGTLNVLEVCKLSRIQHAVLTGSISSYGEEDCVTPKDELSPYRSHYPYFLDRIFPSRLNYYRDSKALATRKAIEFAQEHALSITILEPAWVYGEREFRTGFYSYVKAVKEGLRWMPGCKQNLFHVIYAKDVARAYVMAARSRLPGVERIIIGNPRPEFMHRILDLFCREAGTAAPRFLPRWVAYPAGFCLEIISTLLRASEAPLLTRGRVNMFYDSIAYSAQKAKHLLGFEAEFSIEQGIQQTVTWYKANQLL